MKYISKHCSDFSAVVPLFIFQENECCHAWMLVTCFQTLVCIAPHKAQADRSERHLLSPELYHNALRTGMALNMDMALKCKQWLTGTGVSPLGSVAVLQAHISSHLACGFSLCIKHCTFAVFPARKTHFSDWHPRCLDSEKSWQRPQKGPWTFLEKLILIAESLD